MRASAVSGVAELTPRQQEVFEHLRRGRPLAEIAEALQIRLETVRIHTRAIRRKLGVASRAELIGMVGVMEEEMRLG
jgi:LuxR family maltose regulon positive regulatory protein